jgi:hypothetical protein
MARASAGGRPRKSPRCSICGLALLNLLLLATGAGTAATFLLASLSLRGPVCRAGFLLESLRVPMNLFGGYTRLT